MLDPAYVDHTAPAGSAPGVGGVAQKLRALWSAFPDARYALGALVSEGDVVAVRWTMSGTQTGVMGAIAPTGRVVSVRGMDFYRVANGRIAEHWDVVDELAMMRQLGRLPGA